jgi:hypothetical protein
MKVGEYGITIEGALVQVDGEPLDLSDADSITLVMKLKKTVITKDCEIIDAENGLIEYVIEEGILDAAGTLKMEVVIDYDAEYRFKSKGIIKEKVERALDV